MDRKRTQNKGSQGNGLKISPMTSSGIPSNYGVDLTMQIYRILLWTSRMSLQRSYERSSVDDKEHGAIISVMQTAPIPWCDNIGHADTNKFHGAIISDIPIPPIHWCDVTCYNSNNHYHSTLKYFDSSISSDMISIYSSTLKYVDSLISSVSIFNSLFDIEIR